MNLERPHDVNLADHFLLRHVREARGGRTALITRDRSWSYAEVAALMQQTASALQSLGVRRGERVLLALGDSVEFVATWYAAQAVGAVTAEVYTFLQPKDYAYYLAYTEAVVVVVDTTTLGPMRDAMRHAGRTPALLCAGVDPGDLGPSEHHLATLAGAQPAVFQPVPVGDDDVVIWKFTTGSTGNPKACVHPLRSPLASCAAYARGVLDIREDDVVLPVPKLFFGYARDLAAMFPFGVGAAGIIFPERCTPALLFELIARHRPTILVNVPTMMQAMIDAAMTEPQDLSCLRLCTSAGEALPEPLHRRWLDAFGVEVLDGIGSSEAYHIYISNRPGQVRPGSVGECVPGYSTEVVDERGVPVEDGDVGRLWIRCDTAALMYWGDPERSRQTFADHLVMSGDLVDRDPDGFHRYRGRADDLLKVGGIWVAPAEIEGCIAAHPDVVECAVTGVEREGLVVACAFLVVKPGAALTTADAVQSHVRLQLSPHKVPREVVFVDALPRTGSGKIDRRALRDGAALTTGRAQR